MPVPAKHRIDSLRELSVVRFVDATGVNPKVSQTITSGLFCAEADLVVAKLALCRTIYHVFKADLFGIRSPCVREYGILGNVVANKVSGQLDFAGIIVF